MGILYSGFVLPLRLMHSLMFMQTGRLFKSNAFVQSLEKILGSNPSNVPNPRLTHLPSWQQLSPTCISILGMNPGKFTLQGTNTYLIGSGPARTLVDTGDGRPEYLENLQDAMKEANCQSIERIILTHHHYDHVGGVKSVLDVFGSIPVYKKGCDGMGEFLPIDSGDIFDTEGERIQIIDTPGHTQDHVSIILGKQRALISGDCILGAGTTVFENLAQYMDTLHKLELLCKDEEAFYRIYPGHGPVVEEGLEKIQEYIKHRLDREKQILEIIHGNSGPMTSLEITREIYGDLPFSIQISAQNNVCLHLEKLVSEHKVSRDFLDLYKSCNT